ncbi:DUF423 domain-containing protein [Methylovirgula ligni]|uniref:Uncharacterized membrane protein YgdD (TMEM256/DUF423 family) n=1 Tax=Methylovirgula ligni TaxID=569860 RepID=A0A3D9YU05_9HYPH|nr:DUF423 domain-containing protein [Methylovirgula ligni]QAY96320.1 DUF423 domain-containing protein [Methylovirgula ligni]REF85964.1 uncharacterized membrane protein YgdD (TMEM256/DUF423 family) [Methylovirgula ligni]
MTKAPQIFAGFAALLAAAGVAEAAAAAHALPSPLLKTSSEFLLANAVGIVALSAFAQTAIPASRLLYFGIAALLLGTLLFSGELTSHAIFPQSPLVMIAPIGGSLTILGWLIAAAGLFGGAWRRRD